MIQENIYEAKTHLSRLIALALDGEDVVIAKDGKPVAKIVPFTKEHVPVVYGALKGKIRIAEDFDSFSGEVAEMFKDYVPGDGG